MNIILFEEHELGRSLPRRDERTIHLLKVLHKKTGDSFEAGILGGMRGTGRIEKINFDGSIFVSVQADEPPEPRLPIRLAAAFVRPIQIKRMLRDISNIGAAAVDFFGTELGEKSYRDTKLFKDGGATAALIEGAVQARDTTVPQLELYESAEEWLLKKPWFAEDAFNRNNFNVPLLCAMDNIRPIGSFFNITPADRPVVIAIGPERGWTDRERNLFEDAGFLRLSMGKRALRTETACVAAAALAMEKIG